MSFLLMHNLLWNEHMVNTENYSLLMGAMWECKKSRHAQTPHTPTSYLSSPCVTGCTHLHLLFELSNRFQVILPLTNSQKPASHNPSKIHSYKQTSRSISSQSTILIVVFLICVTLNV